MDSVSHGVAVFFSKGPDRKYFRPTDCTVCHNYSALPLQCESGHRHYMDGHDGILIGLHLGTLKFAFHVIFVFAKYSSFACLFDH